MSETGQSLTEKQKTCTSISLINAFCDNMSHWYHECIKCTNCGVEYHSIRHYDSMADARKGIRH